VGKAERNELDALRLNKCRPLHCPKDYAFATSVRPRTAAELKFATAIFVVIKIGATTPLRKRPGSSPTALSLGLARDRSAAHGIAMLQRGSVASVTLTSAFAILQ
jgi:hypothetical protein